MKLRASSFSVLELVSLFPVGFKPFYDAADAPKLDQVFSPSSSSCHLSVFDTMVPLWQVLMVQSLLSQMLERVGTHRQGFSDNVENLREVVRSILTFCGERFESLPLLWVVLTAYRCLKDQVQEHKCLPPESLIQSTLLSNPISGAAGSAEVGTLDELGRCPYRAALYDDMGPAIRFAKGLDFVPPPMEQAMLFLQDAHAFLHVLMRLESNSRCPDWESMSN